VYNDQGTMDNGMTDSGMGGQYIEGTPVYDVNGDKVGTVSEHGVQDNALVIHHGMFRQDVYVPLGVIARNDVDGLYLNVTKDDVLNQDWTATNTSSATMDTTYATTGTMAADTTTTDTQDVRVPVYEEDLVVGKRQTEIGDVRLHKDVVTEQETVNVPLQQERVTVERVAVDQPLDAATVKDAFTERDIDVPVKGEEAVVGKQARVVEEVRLRKDVVTEQEQVSDTVRKERVVVDGVDEAQGIASGRTGTTASGMARTVADDARNATWDAEDTARRDADDMTNR